MTMLDLRLAFTGDAPALHDCADVPIPGSGSAPLQVVGAIPAACRKVKKIVCTNTTGKLIGLYVGGVGSETYIGLADGERSVQLSPGQRVSVRSMDTSAVTSGNLMLEFMEPA
jgi:hypothetical protein